MLYFLVENPPHNLSDPLKLKALLELGLDLLAEFLLDTLADVEIVNFLEQPQPDFIDAADDADGHSLR